MTHINAGEPPLTIKSLFLFTKDSINAHRQLRRKSLDGRIDGKRTRSDLGSPQCPGGCCAMAPQPHEGCRRGKIANSRARKAEHKTFAIAASGMSTPCIWGEYRMPALCAPMYYLRCLGKYRQAREGQSTRGTKRSGNCAMRHTRILLMRFWRSPFRTSAAIPARNSHIASTVTSCANLTQDTSLLDPRARIADRARYH